MKGFPVRRLPVRPVPAGAVAVAEQLTLVRRRAQPTAVYIARLTVTAVFAYLVALQLPGGSPHSVLAPLTALLVAQASLSHTIRSAAQRVLAVTAGVLAAVAVAAYVPFSWWVLGLLTAATLALGIVLRLREEILEVPISAMLIFSSGAHAAATSRITETLVGAAAGLAAGLVMAPIRVQPAREAVGDLSRQMADLLGQMASGLSEAPDPKRAAEWLDRTRALRGEIERVDDALAQAEDSVRLNPRKLRTGNPAAGLRDGVDTLERAATDMRVRARRTASRVRARRGRLSGAAVTGCRVTCYSGGPRHSRGGPCSTRRIMGAAFSRSSPHMHSAHQVAPASASEPARSAAAAGLAGLMAHMTRSNGPVAGPTVTVGVRVSAPAAVAAPVTLSARQAVRKARISRTVAASGCRGLRSWVYMMGAPRPTPRVIRPALSR
jgi:hypothetical protein